METILYNPLWRTNFATNPIVLQVHANTIEWRWLKGTSFQSPTSRQERGFVEQPLNYSWLNFKRIKVFVERILIQSCLVPQTLKKTKHGSVFVCLLPISFVENKTLAQSLFHLVHQVYRRKRGPLAEGESTISISSLPQRNHTQIKGKTLIYFGQARSRTEQVGDQWFTLVLLWITKQLCLDIVKFLCNKQKKMSAYNSHLVFKGSSTRLEKDFIWGWDGFFF